MFFFFTKNLWFIASHCFISETEFEAHSLQTSEININLLINYQTFFFKKAHLLFHHYSITFIFFSLSNL